MTSTISPPIAQPSLPSGGEGSRRFMAPRGILALTMLATGAAGLIYEYVISTVLSYLLGNSIEQFSITIGVMFAMMGVGGFMQKSLRHYLAEFFIAAELLLVVAGGFAPIFLQWAYAQTPDDFGWIKFLYICLIGFLIGVEIPLVMRINERFTNNLGSNIAGTWAWDYIGGAVGVALWIWMLRHFVPITHISFVVAGFNLAVALLSFVFFWRRGMLSNRVTKAIMAALAVVVAVLMTLGMARVDAWSKILSQNLYDNPIAFELTTKYQNIVMTQGPHPTNPNSRDYELWLNGNKQFSSVDEKIYHELLVHPAMSLSAQHQRVLILGGGDGLALREVLKYPDVEHVTLVDLDPEMIRLAQTNKILVGLNEDSFRDARVTSSLDDSSLNTGIHNTGQQRPVIMETDQVEATECTEKDQQSECSVVPVTEKVADVDIFTVDADQFLSRTTGSWDVVVVDLPDPNSVELSKLYSREFYTKIRKQLSPDGVVVVQSTSPYHSKETFLCILRTMAAAGLGTTPYHDNVPSFGDWGWVMGSPTLSSAELGDRADSIDTFEVETSEIGPANVRRAMIFNKGWLDAKSSEISTIMRPVVFQLYVYEGWKVE